MAVVKGRIKTNTYRDSIALMRTSMELRKLSGISKAEIILGTEVNKQILIRSGLMTEEIEQAGNNDLIIAVEGNTVQNADAALDKAEEMLTKGFKEVRDTEFVANSLAEAIQATPDATVALISIPGLFVKREAFRALKRGLHTLIFSSNVSLEDELELKEYAREHGLLVMGPDCGTAIISGKGLAFANEIRAGSIGIVGASGTGIQEVSCLIHQLGEGITHAIGTGSNDVSSAIGGITMLAGIKLLEADPATRVIVLVSKPPALETQEKILAVLEACTKPVVVNFIGNQKSLGKKWTGRNAYNLEETAKMAVAYAQNINQNEILIPGELSMEQLMAQAQEKRERQHLGQRYIRGLYSGGTLANEACLVLNETIDTVYSNVSLPTVHSLKNSNVSYRHSIIDLGAEEFTAGKPHPMLEPAVRNERIVQEAKDPQVAVLLLDFVLGYGSHADPVGVTLAALKEAIQIAKEDKRSISIVASVCGTDEDFQNKRSQVEKLQQIGVTVLPTNAQAAKFASLITARGMEVDNNE